MILGLWPSALSPVSFLFLCTCLYPKRLVLQAAICRYPCQPLSVALGLVKDTRGLGDKGRSQTKCSELCFLPVSSSSLAPAPVRCPQLLCLFCVCLCCKGSCNLSIVKTLWTAYCPQIISSTLSPPVISSQHHTVSRVDIQGGLFS